MKDSSKGVSPIGVMVSEDLGVTPVTGARYDTSVLLYPVAKQQSFNILGCFADDLPNYQFNGYIVKRSGAEKNRLLVVRFMKSDGRRNPLKSDA